MNYHQKHEIWKPIPGYEGYYEASSFGRIRSVDREVTNRLGRKVKYKGKQLSMNNKTNKGYYQIILSKQGVKKKWTAHRWILLAFKGPCPGGLEACHNDANKLNNRIDNLRYDTRQNNKVDIYQTHPDKPAYIKFSLNDVLEIDRRLKEGESPSTIAKEYGVSYGHIYSIKVGKSWYSVTGRKYSPKPMDGRFRSYGWDYETSKEIIQRRLAGEKVCNLAKEYGVHRTTISRLIAAHKKGKCEYLKDEPCRLKCKHEGEI